MKNKRFNIHTKDGYYYEDVMIMIDYTGDYINKGTTETIYKWFMDNQDEDIRFYNGYMEEVYSCLIEDISVFELLN